MRKVWSCRDLRTHLVPLQSSKRSIGTLPLDRTDGPPNLVILQNHATSFANKGKLATNWNPIEFICLDLLEPGDQQEQVHFSEQAIHSQENHLQIYHSTQVMGTSSTPYHQAIDQPSSANPDPDRNIFNNHLLHRRGLEQDH